MKSLLSVISEFFKPDHVTKPNNELEQHFFLEFNIGNLFKSNKENVYEQYGAYKGQKQLIIDISKELYARLKNGNKEPFVLYRSELMNYSNIFFDKLIIYPSNKTGYLPSKSGFLHNSFNMVVIYIDTDFYNDYESIVRCLMHEMLHAWNNYISHVKKSRFTPLDISKEVKYRKSVNFHFDDSPEARCKEMVHDIRQIEQNAYLAELSVELDVKRFDVNKYHSPEEAYKEAYRIFLDSDVWRKYSNHWKYILKLNNEKPENDKQIFTDTYNDINDTRLTFKEVYRKLSNRIYDILQHIESTVPKIFYDYYKEQIDKEIQENVEGIMYSNRYTIEMMKLESDISERKKLTSLILHDL